MFLLVLAVCALKSSILPKLEGKYEDSEGSKEEMHPTHVHILWAIFNDKTS